MRWWLALAFAVVAAATAFAVEALFTRHAESALQGDSRDTAIGKAVNAAFAVEAALHRPDFPGAVEAIGKRRGLALFVLGPEGRLLTAPRALGVPWRAIPHKELAVASALRGRRFVDVVGRQGATLVGLSVRDGAVRRAVVAYAPQPRAYAASLSIFRREVLRAALWASLLGAGIGFLIASLIALRLRRIAAAALRLERGDFDAPLEPRFRDEVGQLAETISRMSERLRQSFAALGAERDQLGRLLERLHDGVITVDRDLHVEFANARARRLLEPARLDPGAPLPGQWLDLPLRDLAAHLLEAGAGVAEARVAADEWTYALVGIPPSRAGGDESAVIVVTDISERERQERAEREFVANAAHELRTPLATIAAAVEQLDAGAKEIPAQRDRFLGHIRHECERLGRLARALLVLARAQTNAERPPLAPVELRPLLTAVADDLDPRKGVVVQVQCAPGLTALTERTLAEQVFSNIAVNAAKHTARGKIVIRAVAEGRSVRVDVSDTGPGMPRATKERIFDRFYRAGARDEDGFGLGLSIVREAVRALGGVVEVDTRPGAGTTVSVRLPAREAIAA